MTTLRPVLLLAAALAFLQTVPAAGQEGPAESSLRWFDSFDQDRDTVLTPEEVEATGSVQFLRIDRDASGTLTLEEYLAANPDSDDDEIRKSQGRFEVMDRRGSADGQGDGEATPQDFINFGKFVIELADFNGDGRLSRQEFIEGITSSPQ
jgi:Ca2+-binding EF-hand superfamily protein